jgi:hypothetical protein
VIALFDNTSRRCSPRRIMSSMLCDRNRLTAGSSSIYFAGTFKIVPSNLDRVLKEDRQPLFHGPKNALNYAVFLWTGP